MIVAALCLFCLCMAVSMATDLSHMIISNRLVLFLVALFVVFAVSADWSAARLGLHAATGGAVLLLTFGAFALGWMGGGDAKLIAATALWFGPTLALWDYLFFASLLGGVLTLTILLARACLRPTTGNPSVDRLLDPASGVPYGVALGAAGILVALRLPEMQSILGLI